MQSNKPQTKSIHIQLFGRNKKQTSQAPAPAEKPKKKPKIKAISIGKYELKDGIVTFFALNGTLKKHWVKRGEFFVSEITQVESAGNLISFTRGGTVYSYIHTNKAESLKPLEEQVLAFLSNEQTALQNNQTITALKTELASAINTALPAIDVCFDVLVGLNQKRMDWTQVDQVAAQLTANVNFAGQILPPLNVDLTKIPVSVKSQVPKDVTKSAMDTLKAIYGYFTTLTSPDGLTENAANIENAKNAVLAYYAVNDVLLAKATGQKDDPQEISSLETVIVGLADKSNLKIDLDDLRSALANFGRGEIAVNDVRGMFKVEFRSF